MRYVIRRTPCLVFGLLLLVPVLVVRYLGDPLWLPDWCDRLLATSALLLPGAIKRLRWRQCGVALLLAAAIVFWKGSGAYTRLSQSGYSPLTYWCLTTIPVLAVAAMEAFTASGRRRRRFLWLTITCVAVVSILEGITLVVQLTGLSIPRGSRVGSAIPLNWLLYPALQILFVWLAFPLALRVVEAQQRARMMRLGATSAAAFAGFLIFSWHTLPALAMRSLSGHGPFLRTYSANVVGTLRSERSRQLLWREFEDSLAQDSSLTAPLDRHDWQATLLAALRHQDPEDTAQRLGFLFRARPSKDLASLAAATLIEHQRYEHVPLLMRYALLGSVECTEALERVGEPRAAIPLACYGIKYETSVRERVLALLGAGAGETPQAWILYAYRELERLPSPFDDDVTAEMNELAERIDDYWYAEQSRENALNEWAQRFARQHPDLTAREALAEARRTFQVDEPNWNERSTDALGREIERYIDDVDALIQQHLKDPQ